MIAKFQAFKPMLRFCIEEKMFKKELTINSLRERVVKIEEGIAKWRKYLKESRQDQGLNGQGRTLWLWKESLPSFMVTTARFLPVSLFHLQQVVLVALQHEQRVELQRERDHEQQQLLQRVQGGSGEWIHTETIW